MHMPQLGISDLPSGSLEYSRFMITYWFVFRCNASSWTFHQSCTGKSLGSDSFMRIVRIGRETKVKNNFRLCSQNNPKFNNLKQRDVTRRFNDWAASRHAQFVISFRNFSVFNVKKWTHLIFNPDGVAWSVKQVCPSSQCLFVRRKQELWEFRSQVPDSQPHWPEDKQAA